MIGYRGNLAGPTLSGEQTEVVHFASEVRRAASSYYKLEPMCRTGAWNIVYTDDSREVTCPHCLKRMD